MNTSTVPFVLPRFRCKTVKVGDNGTEIEAGANRDGALCPLAAFPHAPSIAIIGGSLLTCP